MIAEVVVNHRTKSLDKAFDYAISDGQNIGIGSSVIVPFGKGNKPKEGYVIGVKEKSSAKKLKSIERLSKNIQLFDEKQLELIKWMRDKYLVTYLDAIHALIPAGTDIKPEEWIVMTGEIKAGEKDELLLKLSEYGGACEINRFLGLFETNIKNRITKLGDKGLIKTEFRDSRTVGDKVVRVAEINADAEDVDNIISTLEKSNSSFSPALISPVITIHSSGFMSVPAGIRA